MITYPSPTLLLKGIVVIPSVRLFVHHFLGFKASRGISVAISGSSF